MSETKRIIKIVVDTQNARDIEATSKKLDQLNRSTKSLAGGMSYLTSAFSGWLGFLGVSQLTRMSDEMQNIGNRLKIITGSTEGASAAFAQLAQVADRTNQGIAQTGEIYTRLAVSLKGAKATTQEVMTLTESLINTFRVAGATTTETTNTIIQLGQAFASGELRGQELRSVMEQNATLATLLRERLGADIYKQAQKGLIKVSTVLEILAQNQTKVNEEAKKLAPTFEQVLTKAVNQLQITLKELNDKYELSSKFATLMSFATKNLGDTLAVMAAVALGVAVTALPALVASLQSLWATIMAFALANPVVASIAAVTTLATIAYVHWDRLDLKIRSMRATMLDWVADFREMQVSFRQWTGATRTPEGAKSLEESKRQALDARRTAMQLRSGISSDLLKKVSEQEANDPIKQMQALIAKLKAMENQSSKVEKLKDILGDLNKEFLSGKISLGTYNQKLNEFEMEKLTRGFKEGKQDIFAFSEGLKKLAIEDLNVELAKGSINSQEYKKRLEGINFTLLNQQVAQGKITLEEYNKEVAKLESKFSESSPIRMGVDNYMNSIGTLAENIAGGVTKTLSAMEDGIVQFVKTGKFNFKDFADTVIEEIIRIQVRMAIAGIISSVVGAFTTSSSSSSASGVGGGYNSGATLGNSYNFANGGIMSSQGMIPIQKYANGGIAKSPQMSIFGEGRMNEAYVPLPDGKRIPVAMEGGSGGTNVVVNVNVATGEESVQASSQKAKALGTLVSNIVSSELIKQKRPGGLLNNG